MSTAKKIKILLIENDMTARDLAEKINLSESAFSRKMKKDDFLESELRDIAKAFNATSVQKFVFENGRKL